MKIGELQTTEDINQKFALGFLNGDEVWALENKSKIKGAITEDELK